MSEMKAVHYEGAFKVSVKNVPLPKLEHPDDAIIKVTTAGKSFFPSADNWIGCFVYARHQTTLLRHLSNYHLTYMTKFTDLLYSYLR
jgi:hypothetical protein